MPLGLKPTCSVCKTTSSSMWKKSSQGEIFCHHCTGRGGAGGGGAGAGAGTAGGTGGSSSGGGGFSAATLASTSTAPSQSNGGGGGKQSKQEIHRRSARLRNTKYKSAPAAEKKVSTKGKGRRHIFKLKNPIKAPESVSTIITAESIFYKGVYYQIGDVVSVIDEQDGKPYYAQIRGFIQDQYCEKSAALTWLIPTLSSPRDQFDPASYIIAKKPEEGIRGKVSTSRSGWRPTAAPQWLPQRETLGPRTRAAAEGKSCAHQPPGPRPAGDLIACTIQAHRDDAPTNCATWPGPRG
ncbi:GATA zinc finger domain-containing protein 1 isoform X2 [Phyllostomus hastatus]|nr:GATA zinc finger domain-containing protein 1 isoform X2 [Phyllostomus hastatus]